MAPPLGWGRMALSPVLTRLLSSSLLIAMSSTAAAALTPQLTELVAQHGQLDAMADHDAHAVLSSLSARHRRHPPPAAASRKPVEACPEELQASVNASGLLPVDWFRGPNVTCDQAARLAINASATVCGGTVYFATSCDFDTTVVVPGDVNLHGGGNGGGDEFSFRPQTRITGPKKGPAFIVQHVTNVQFQNLEIMGWNTGVIVTDSAVVRFTNVAIHANTQGAGADDVNLTAAGKCRPCAAASNVPRSDTNPLVVLGVLPRCPRNRLPWVQCCARQQQHCPGDRKFLLGLGRGLLVLLLPALSGRWSASRADGSRCASLALAPLPLIFS